MIKEDRKILKSFAAFQKTPKNLAVFESSGSPCDSPSMGLSWCRMWFVSPLNPHILRTRLDGQLPAASTLCIIVLRDDDCDVRPLAFCVACNIRVRRLRGDSIRLLAPDDGFPTLDRYEIVHHDRLGILLSALSGVKQIVVSTGSIRFCHLW